MTSFLSFRLLPALLSAFVLLPLAAHAQVIQPDPGGASCELTEQCAEHKYDFVPASPDQVFLRWQVRGDLKLLTPDDQNPAVICSVGYGKGRITAHYYTFRKDDRCREQCPDTIYHTLDYDVFKQFKAPEPIEGPTCVLPGQRVTYSVPPLLTDWPHRRENIGTDAYFWSGFPAGSALRFSGDSSAVTVDLPAPLPGGFKVLVQVGRCNKATPLVLGVSRDQLLAASVGPCQLFDAGPYLGLNITTQAGTTYTIGIPPFWDFANGGSCTLTGTGAVETVYFSGFAGGGNVVVTASGGCSGLQTTGWSVPPRP